MKKCFLVSLIFFSLVLSSCNQIIALWKSPVILLDAVELSFDSQLYKEQAFKVINVGRSDLVFNFVVSKTFAIYDSKKNLLTSDKGWGQEIIIPPRKEKTFIVRFFPDYTRFNYSGIVEILSNDKSNEYLQIKLNGKDDTVVLELLNQPTNRTYTIGPIIEGSSTTFEDVKIKCNASVDIKINSTELSGDVQAFTPKYSLSPFIISPGAEMSLPFRFTSIDSEPKTLNVRLHLSNGSVLTFTLIGLTMQKPKLLIKPFHPPNPLNFIATPSTPIENISGVDYFVTNVLIEMTNAGDMPLEVSQTSFISPGFGLLGDDASSYSVLSNPSPNYLAGAFTIEGKDSRSFSIQHRRKVDPLGMPENVDTQYGYFEIVSNSEHIENNNLRVDLKASWVNIQLPVFFQVMEQQTVEVGSDSSTSGKPAHLVPFVYGFEMARTEVDYSLWHEVYQFAINNGYRFFSQGKEGATGAVGANPTNNGGIKPVVSVSWQDAIVWCNALSRIQEFEPFYLDKFGNEYKDATQDFISDARYWNWDVKSYRLPTEAEWERAAKDTILLDTYAVLDPSCKIMTSDYFHPFTDYAPYTIPSPSFFRQDASPSVVAKNGNLKKPLSLVEASDRFSQDTRMAKPDTTFRLVENKHISRHTPVFIESFKILKSSVSGLAKDLEAVIDSASNTIRVRIPASLASLSEVPIHYTLSDGYMESNGELFHSGDTLDLSQAAVQVQTFIPGGMATNWLVEWIKEPVVFLSADGSDFYTVGSRDAPCETFEKAVELAEFYNLDEIRIAGGENAIPYEYSLSFPVELNKSIKLIGGLERSTWEVPLSGDLKVSRLVSIAKDSGIPNNPYSLLSFANVTGPIKISGLEMTLTEDVATKYCAPLSFFHCNQVELDNVTLKTIIMANDSSEESALYLEDTSSLILKNSYLTNESFGGVNLQSYGIKAIRSKVNIIASHVSGGAGKETCAILMDGTGGGASYQLDIFNSIIASGNAQVGKAAAVFLGTNCNLLMGNNNILIHAGMDGGQYAKGIEACDGAANTVKVFNNIFYGQGEQVSAAVSRPMGSSLNGLEVKNNNFFNFDNIADIAGTNYVLVKDLEKASSSCSDNFSLPLNLDNYLGNFDGSGKILTGYPDLLSHGGLNLIDKGLGSFPKNSSGQPTDISGETNRSDSGNEEWSIGCWEYNTNKKGPSIVVNASNDQLDGDYDSLSIREAVAIANFDENCTDIKIDGNLASVIDIYSPLLISRTINIAGTDMNEITMGGRESFTSIFVLDDTSTKQISLKLEKIKFIYSAGVGGSIVEGAETLHKLEFNKCLVEGIVSDKALFNMYNLFCDASFFIKNINSSANGGVVDTVSVGRFHQFTNSVFYGNKGDGGVFEVDGTGASLELINCTLHNNGKNEAEDLETDPFTFFIDNNASLKLYNTLMSSSLIGPMANASATSTVDVKASIISIGNTIPGTTVFTGDPCYLTEGLVEGEDGLFGTSDDGLNLLGFCGAINFGENNLLPSNFDKDAKEDPRFYDNGIVDCGAYEYQGEPIDYSSMGSILFVDSGGPKNGDGLSWATAMRSLSSALSLADSRPNIQEIWVARGTYLPEKKVGGITSRCQSFTFRNNLTVYGGFNGTESSLSQRNWQENQTILSGDLNRNDGTFSSPLDFLSNTSATNKGENSYHVFKATSGQDLNSSAVYDGFYITGGYAYAASPFTSYNSGSAMYIEKNNSPTIRNCVIAGNLCDNDFGNAFGTIYIEGGAGLQIDACVFYKNKVRGGTAQGGAIYLDGSGLGVVPAINVTIANTLFYENESKDVGAAIYALGDKDCNLDIINCTFYKNLSEKDNQGGIYGQGSRAIITVKNSLLAFNGNNYRDPATAITWENSFVKGKNLVGVNNIDGSTITDTNFYKLFRGSDETGSDIELSDILGPDNLFATLDDGLIPLPSSVPESPYNKGATVAYVRDLTGSARQYGTSVDIGAYESQEAFYVVLKHIANGGVGSLPSDETRTPGAIVTLSSNILTREGYTHVGWNTDPSGNGIFYNFGETITMPASNLTVYAHWEANSYTISFDGRFADGGSTPSQTIQYGETAALHPNGFTFDGHIFMGWSTTASSDLDYPNMADYTMGAGDVTLYAVWIISEGGASPYIGNLALVPAGKFLRDGNSNNVSEITRDYNMSHYPITRAQFKLVMGSDPSDVAYSSSMDDPVQNTNWYQAIAFCNKLSLLEGLQEVYSVEGVDFSSLSFSAIPSTNDVLWNNVICDWNADGYRLPTEMEWMWAAMGSVYDSQAGAMQSGINVSGYNKPFAGYNGSNNLDDYAWHYHNSNVKTHPVGTKFPNELGIYDISGNVNEWCWDVSGNYPDELATDYRGSTSGSDRVRRGGSWDDGANYLELSYRGNYYPYYSGIYGGFRVVRRDVLDTLNSNKVGDLKLVPAGIFQRSNAGGDTTRITQSFYMAESPIIRFNYFMTTDNDPTYEDYSSGTNDPVHKVSWYMAIAFCNKVSIQEGLTPVYSVNGVDFKNLTFSAVPTSNDGDWNQVTCNWEANGYRLPTEMEWMWAAMGAGKDSQPGAMQNGINVTGWEKPFAGYNGSNSIDDYVWYNLNKTQAVRQKLPNELGLYDMSGNAEEWCWDVAEAIFPTGNLVDYRGGTLGDYRVFRGGSVNGFVTDYRLDDRREDIAFQGVDYRTIRLVRSY